MLSNEGDDDYLMLGVLEKITSIIHKLAYVFYDYSIKVRNSMGKPDPKEPVFGVVSVGKRYESVPTPCANYQVLQSPSDIAGLLPHAKPVAMMSTETHLNT
ncbi:hypothetical protein RUM44_000083 [Polyplax serrata]|uniref:Uncharacterized protein n=1 Tax=Polyplax serrata TaxID=468196 RepID=A0ABR1B4F5_POLSC